MLTVLTLESGQQFIMKQIKGLPVN